MGKLSGTVLILAGISLAAYTLSSRHEGTAEMTVARTPVGAAGLAGPTAGAQAPEARAARISEAAPKEGEPPVLATPAGAEATATPVRPAQASASPAPPLSAAAPPPQAASTEPGTRPRGGAVVRMEDAPPRMPVGDPAAAAGPPLDRPALTREIQRHLKRVGCYKGPVTGTWDPAVRQAMKALTDRVNAALPIDQPDPVLLAMVQNQAPGTCNAPCPAGEAKAADGRCLPTALVAQAGKLRAPAAGERRTAAGGERKHAPAVARSAPAEMAAPEPAEGRMSLAGPVAPRTRAAVSPAPAPARARAHSAASAHGYTSPRASVAPRSSTRSASARARGRYRAAQRQSPGVSGFSWFLPF